MSGSGTRPTAGLLDTEDRRNALAQALLGIPSRIGNAFTGMAQRGLLANEQFMSGEGADQQFLPTMDSGGRLGALASFLSQNMAMGGPAGSLGAGPSMARKASALPMDEASRMARAAELGFTSQAYHATHAPDFAKFDKSLAGSAADIGNNVGKVIWATDKPSVADTYLGGMFVNRANVPHAPDIGGGVGRYYSEGGRVMPLSVRAGDFDVWDMNGAMFGHSSVQKALYDAKKAGAPGVIFENLRDPGGMATGMGEKSTVYAIFNPKDIRSRFAAFDPAKRNSPDLLAGYANPFAGLLQGEPQP